MKTATLLLLSLLFALPAQAAERQPYTCDNGSRLDISFAEDAEGRPQATLHFADEAMILPQVPAASGALYRKGRVHKLNFEHLIFLKPPLYLRQHVPHKVALVQMYQIVLDTQSILSADLKFQPAASAYEYLPKPQLGAHQSDLPNLGKYQDRYQQARRW